MTLSIFLCCISVCLSFSSSLPVSSFRALTYSTVALRMEPLFCLTSFTKA